MRTDLPRSTHGQKTLERGGSACKTSPMAKIPSDEPWCWQLHLTICLCCRCSDRARPWFRLRIYWWGWCQTYPKHLRTIRLWEQRTHRWVEAYRSGLATKEAQNQVREFSSTKYKSHRRVPEAVACIFDDPVAWPPNWPLGEFFSCSNLMQIKIRLGVCFYSSKGAFLQEEIKFRLLLTLDP